MGFVVRTTNGQVRLFPAQENAVKWERKQPHNVFVLAFAQVNPADYHVGTIPPDGVAISPEKSINIAWSN